MPKHHYSESTAQKIVHHIRNNPGHTGREIAKALGLKKEHVNSWLYTPWVQKKYGVKVREYRWYSSEVAPLKTSHLSSYTTPQSKKESSTKVTFPPTIDTWKQEIRKYSPETVEQSFTSSNYNNLTDDQRAALAEVLEEHKQAQSKVAHPTSFPLVKRDAVWTLVASTLALLLVLLLPYFLATTTNDRSPVPNQDNPSQQVGH